MVSTEPVPLQVSPRQQIAPLLHTILLLAVLLGFSAAAAHSQHEFALRHGRVPFYLATMFWEWILVGYVLWGLRRRQVSIGEITGGRWKSPEDVLLDVAIAAGFWLASMIVLSALAYAWGLTGAGAVTEAKKKLGFLVPQTHLEMVLWLAVSATAGFCEEIIFRGYLQRQFAAFTGSAFAGLLLQSILFGASHAYEGSKRMVLIAVYGLMFGLLVLWRKSLRPGMISHFFHDSLAGLVLRALR